MISQFCSRVGLFSICFLNFDFGWVLKCFQIRPEMLHQDPDQLVADKEATRAERDHCDVEHAGGVQGCLVHCSDKTERTREHQDAADDRNFVREGENILAAEI
jgi:hypothetical protein